MKIDRGKIKKLITYDQKNAMRSKNQFLKTNLSNMIDDQFLIEITGGSPKKLAEFICPALSQFRAITGCAAVLPLLAQCYHLWYTVWTEQR